MSAHGEVNWLELQTNQPGAAIEFYQNTLGWQFVEEEMPSGGTYWIGSSSGGPVCGILKVDSNLSNASRWVVYIHVDNLEAALDKATHSGGEILHSPWNVPGVGRIAWIRDASGAEMGWVTPVAMALR